LMFFLAMFYYIVDGIKFNGAIIVFVSLDPLIFHLYGTEKRKKRNSIYTKNIKTTNTISTKNIRKSWN
jgi:hypothetical protein